MINQFQGEYRWLSNFYPVIVEHESIVYPTVEHYYVAMKTLNKGKRLDIAIIPADQAGKVKRIGRTLEIREDWEEIKLNVMSYGIHEKFFNDKELGDKLIATGDQNIVEGNFWGDVFWGVDLKQNPNVGENNLGRLLMSVRDTIIVGRSLEWLDSGIPKNCTQEFLEDACASCEHKSCVDVAHPGGGMGVVDKCSCDLGYWEDDF